MSLMFILIVTIEKLSFCLDHVMILVLMEFRNNISDLLHDNA